MPKVGVEPTRRRVPMRIYFDIIYKVAGVPKSRGGSLLFLFLSLPYINII